MVHLHDVKFFSRKSVFCCRKNFPQHIFMLNRNINIQHNPVLKSQPIKNTPFYVTDNEYKTLE